MGLFPAGGEVRLHGQAGPLNQPRLALQRGMAFVSEDRRGVGLLLEENLEWNIAFTAMQIQDKLLKPVLGGLFKIRDEAAMRTLTQGYIDILDIKCTSPAQKASGTLRRQPAEDLPGQGLRHRAGAAVRVRAHPRHRHRRQAPGAGRPVPVPTGTWA